MHSINFLQPDTQDVKNTLLKKFDAFEVIKHWPASADIKTNIVATALQNNEKIYVKWFTEEGTIPGTKERELIELFNAFSEETQSTFSGSDIIEAGDDPYVYFAMKDIEQTKEKLDFSSMNAKYLIWLYTEYRGVFDAFEKWNVDIISGTKQQDRERISQDQYARIGRRIDNTDSIVSKYITYTAKDLHDMLYTLQNKVKKYDFEYTFGRFWSDHVFSDGTHHQLVDFDNVWYQMKMTEPLGIVRSSVLLPVDTYESYDAWYQQFSLWYDVLLRMWSDEDLLRLQLFHKLMGTIFADFWKLMLQPHNYRTIEQKGIDPMENIQKWIERNWKLVQELFYS